LARFARSRTEPASQVERARMLLAYRQTPSFYAVGSDIGVTHQTVERCVRRAERVGVLAALDNSPRQGREPVITDEARTFVVDLACRKAKDLGYRHELWTKRLLAKHVREHGPNAGHACLAKLAQGTLCKILGAREIKPHKVRYYLERRDPEFDAKMAEVLCVYPEVQLLKQSALAQEGEAPAVAIVSYDEKPGIQAIATTAPDLPPEPGKHATLARDHEYVRHGTLSLLAGIDLLTGEVHASVEEKHRSRESVAFLQKTRRRLPDVDGDQTDPRQSRGARFPGNQNLARRPTRRALHLRLHPEARLLAQSRRGPFLQAGALRAASHPRRVQTGAQRSNPGRHR
jgi:transposase